MGLSWPKRTTSSRRSSTRFRRRSSTRTRPAYTGAATRRSRPTSASRATRSSAKDVYGLSPTELADVYKAADDKLFASRATQIYEARVRYADGTYHDVMFHKATFDDAAGQLAGLIGTILDITTRKDAERALAESEKRYRAVVDALGEGIVLVGRDRQVLACNPAAQAILGLDQVALIYPEHGTDASVLLRQADHAIYAVKSEGKNAVALVS